MVNKSNLKSCLGISIFLLTVTGLAQAATITVGQGRSGGYDFIDIQAGIDAAFDGDTVLVVPGEYVITEPITFRGKAITVRSETGPDETIIRMGTPADPDRASVVVFENNETPASVLEGFTITGGAGCRLWYAKIGGAPEFNWGGGGILVNASSGTVRNCAIVQNRVEDAGGGVMVIWGGSPILTNCIISENSATDPDQSSGGVSCAFDSSVTMTECVVRNNSTMGVGGGVISYSNSSVTMANCEIMSNTAGRLGGGIWAGWASVTLTNCVIARNTAAWGGGGVASAYEALIEISNCTISNNSGAVDAGGGGALSYNGSTTIKNSIICGNTSAKGPEISLMEGGKLSIAYSNVAGGQTKVHVDSGCTLNWGEGNIDADPLFAEPGYWVDINDPNIIVEPDDPNAVWIEGDYHLKSEAGRWTSASLVEPDPNSDSWVLDDITSPCIDRGDPNSLVGDEPDPNGGIINMGACGGTLEASMSIGQLPPLPPPLPLAHWKLDEVEGDITYNSVGDNDGFLFGDPVWQPAEGKRGGALELDGIDDHVITDSVSDPADGPFSVFAWIKGGAPGQVIISQSDGIGIGETWLGADPSDGKLMTGLVPPPLGRFKPMPLESEYVITDGQWHHIGFVWDGSYRLLYVDGIEVAKDITAQNPLKSADGGLYIGANKALDAGTYFSGLIDDVRIYDLALSSEEIATLAQ
ncbi:LamG-like jellyroll fold domain-containing protein [Planctomycetota bacterium]